MKIPYYGSLNKYFQVKGSSNIANTYHPTTPEQYLGQQFFENLDLIISLIKYRFNQPAFMAFLKMERPLLNIFLDNNYEDEPAYVCNVYKDDIYPMEVQTGFLNVYCVSRK